MNCICKSCLFSEAFRVTNVDFREFYNNTLNALNIKQCIKWQEMKATDIEV